MRKRAVKINLKVNSWQRKRKTAYCRNRSRCPWWGCASLELSLYSRFYLTIFRYDAGDHVAIYPTNDPELVERLGKILNVDLDVVFSLVNKDGT